MLLLVIRSYITIGYLWLFYWWLLLIILLVAISVYSFGAYIDALPSHGVKPI
jgi:hypothetical protein